jgi:hypothetical protein
MRRSILVGLLIVGALPCMVRAQTQAQKAIINKDARDLLMASEALRSNNGIVTQTKQQMTGQMKAMTASMKKLQKDSKHVAPLRPKIAAINLDVVWLRRAYAVVATSKTTTDYQVAHSDLEVAAAKLSLALQDLIKITSP